MEQMMHKGVLVTGKCWPQTDHSPSRRIYIRGEPPAVLGGRCCGAAKARIAMAVTNIACMHAGERAHHQTYQNHAIWSRGTSGVPAWFEL